MNQVGVSELLISNGTTLLVLQIAVTCTGMLLSIAIIGCH